MKQIGTVAILALFTLSTAACGTTDTPVTPSSTESTTVTATSRGGRAALPSIAGIAAADPNFSTLVRAAQRAGIVGLLDGNQQLTVFAPTNAAFDAAASALGFADGVALVDGLDLGTLAAVLQYHVTRGDRNAQSVVSAGSLRMLDGNTTSITADAGGARINGVLIAATDIRARNGLVHVITGVLLPPQ